MRKHLMNLTIFQARTKGPIGSLQSALKRWSEARELRKEERMRDEIASQLTPQIRYDIGVSDCRPGRSKSAGWD
jgi:hypothetical protein